METPKIPEEIRTKIDELDEQIAIIARQIRRNKTYLPAIVAGAIIFGILIGYMIWK